MSRLSNHAIERQIERIDEVESRRDARKFDKQARQYGLTINKFIKYPKFFKYLQNKEGQTTTCRIRIYHNQIYVWRGKNKTLVTVHPIPDRYIKEMEEIDGSYCIGSDDKPAHNSSYRSNY